MTILYTVENCPKCNILKTKLDNKGVEYTVSDNLDVVINKGFMSAPVLDVDGDFMDFGRANQWANEVNV